MLNRLNNKIVMEQVEKHIIESLLDEGQEINEALEEYNNQLLVNVQGMPEYRKYKVKNLSNVIKYTLNGCYKYFEFENHKIDEFLKGLNISRYQTLKDSTDKAELYYYLMFKGTERLFKKYDIKF